MDSQFGQLSLSDPSKRQQQQRSSKIFFTLTGCSRDGSSQQTNIFIIDLMKLSLPEAAEPLSPKLRIDYEERLAGHYVFCVLGSTLYIIEAWNTEVSQAPGTSVLKYDLDDAADDDDTIIDLNISALDKAPAMNGDKVHPVAIPTPDGEKMLVFSTFFSTVKPSSPLAVAFELYDPAAGKWLKIPRPSENWTKERLSSVHRWTSKTEILCSAFLDKYVFFIQTNHGMFKLDLKSLDKGWEDVNESFVGGKSVDSRLGDYFLTTGDGLWVAPSVIYHPKSHRFVSMAEAHASYILPGKAPCPPCITPVVVGDDGECVCIVQLRKHKGPPYPKVPELLIHVYSCSGLIKYLMRKEKWQHLPPGFGKHFRLPVNVRYIDWYVPYSLFSIGAGGTSI